MADVADLAEDSGVSIALTPVQLFAMLNGKSISPGELASNTWHEMPLPPELMLQRFLGSTLPTRGLTPMGSLTSPPLSRMDAWSAQTHYSQPTPPDCWIPPRVTPPDPTTVNRAMAVIQIVGGGLEVGAGALLLLVPEPTMLTKVGGTVLAVHGVDTTQAAIRQLFSGKPVQDFTQQGATWAARQAGTSEKTAQRVGVILDVAVPLAVSVGMIAERVIAIRAGRVILSEEAVAGKMGRVSLAEEEADKAAGKEGGHTLQKHLNVTRDHIKARALRSPNPNAIVSRFFNRQLAESAINDAIKNQRRAIQLWAANPGTALTREFEYSCQSAIGEGFSKATGQFAQLSRVRVVFKVAQSAGKRFYIVTSYPIPQ